MARFQTCSLLALNMHPRVSAVFAAILMLVGILSFSFEQEIDEWVKDYSIQIEKDSVELLGLQENENWPVLIVDFEAGNSNWGKDEANNLLIPRASEYIDQLSSSTTSLNVDIYSSITIPENPMQYYGSDYGIQRDSSEDGTHLPMLLAKEIVNEQMNNVDWSKYDLDGDGWIDRLLILHTSIGQEEGGNSDRIWSHFTTFDDPISLPNDLKIAHYTMASLGTGESGFGTVMHEMLHQMGAYDLYPAHGSINQHSWKGIGDWDIMANGNWNGDGKWPSMPTASTVAEIGVNTSIEIEDDWMKNNSQNCIGPTMILDSISRGGNSLKVQVSNDEYIWIEYRDSFGFDSYLPGFGVLVTYQDLSVGDLEQNELNANPDRPYLVVIEADGNNGLRTGVSDGEQSDLFTNGTSFGNSGIPIRNHDGLLIPWTADVEITDRVYVNFTSSNCKPTFSIDAPNYGVSLLPNEPIELIVSAENNCDFSIDMTSSDGRILLTNTSEIESNKLVLVELYFSSPGSSNSEALVSGVIECGESMYNLETKVLTLSRRPVESSFIAEIDAYSTSIISIPIESEGNGMQRFSAEIDGPLSRIATIGSQLDLQGSDEIVINIDPKGLLAPNMLVKGEIVIYDTSGEKWFIEIELTAQNEDANGFQKLTTPGRAIGIASVLASLWVILGIREKSSSKKQVDNVVLESQNAESYPTENLEQENDAWGRPLD